LLSFRRYRKSLSTQADRNDGDGQIGQEIVFHRTAPQKE